ncbi:MAG: hypothetical protein KC917_12445 [Candidatus Omnitrophica bacterium]|nr:hypothetical protein [Candidatus Omnitrophota bacterium]
MSSKRKFHPAQIPVILTVLLVVGTGWSWVSQKNTQDTAGEVQNRLVNFALESGGEETASMPACCMTLQQAEQAESALIASKEKGAACDHCAGSGTSMTAAGAELPPCCAGSATSKEGSAPSCCPGSSTSKTSVAEAQDLDPETAAMIATVKIPQVQE